MRNFSVVVHLNTEMGWVNTLALAQLITQGSHHAPTFPRPEPYLVCPHIASQLCSCLHSIFSAASKGQRPPPKPLSESVLRLPKRCRARARPWVPAPARWAQGAAQPQQPRTPFTLIHAATARRRDSPARAAQQLQETPRSGYSIPSPPGGMSFL